MGEAVDMPADAPSRRRSALVLVWALAAAVLGLFAVEVHAYLKRNAPPSPVIEVEDRPRVIVFVPFLDRPATAQNTATL